MSNYGNLNNVAKRLREKLSEAQNHRCCYCGVRMLGPGEATLEHIIPHSAGGTTDRENCVVACPRCNVERGRLHASAFLALRADRAEMMREVRAMFGVDNDE